MFLTAWFPLLSFLIAVAATTLYFWDRRNRWQADRAAAEGAKLKRTADVIRQLDEIAQSVRRSLATHHASVIQFRERIGQLSSRQDPAAWDALTAEAERMLEPTLQLSRQLAHAYDEVRQQTQQLQASADTETDPLTGLPNRRGLEQVIASRLAFKARYDNDFSLAMFDIDGFRQINAGHGRQHGDAVLRDFGELLTRCARETDTAGRFGGEEFLVVLPETDLAGAGVFAERVRKMVQEEMALAVSGGVAAVAGGDTPKSLLTRADTALYSAKSAGRNCVFRHSGRTIELVEPLPPAAEAPAAAAPLTAAAPASEVPQPTCPTPLPGQ